MHSESVNLFYGLQCMLISAVIPSWDFPQWFSPLLAGFRILFSSDAYVHGSVKEKTRVHIQITQKIFLFFFVPRLTFPK